MDIIAIKRGSIISLTQAANEDQQCFEFTLSINHFCDKINCTSVCCCSTVK